MTWSQTEKLRYERHKTAGRMRTTFRRLANTGDRCHICNGGGELFEMDGWAAPTWTPCTNCGGSGKKSDAKIGNSDEALRAEDEADAALRDAAIALGHKRIYPTHDDSFYCVDCNVTCPAIVRDQLPCRPTTAADL